jgi:hypothetical protein
METREELYQDTVLSCRLGGCLQRLVKESESAEISSLSSHGVLPQPHKDTNKDRILTIMSIWHYIYDVPFVFSVVSRRLLVRCCIRYDFQTNAVIGENQGAGYNPKFNVSSSGRK